MTSVRQGHEGYRGHCEKVFGLRGVLPTGLCFRLAFRGGYMTCVQGT